MAGTETTEQLRGLQGRSLTLLRAIASHIPNGSIFVVDRDLRVLLADGELYQRMNSPSVEGQLVADASPPAMRELVLQRFQDALAGTPQSVQTEFAGLTIWSRYVPLSDEHGQIFAAMNLSLDVTAHKQSEQALGEAEQHVRLLSAQLESALEAGEMGAWIFDLRSQQMWGSDSQRKLWGMGNEVPEWFPAALAETLVHPDDREQAIAEIERVVQQGTNLSHEFRIVKPNGDLLWIATRARIMRDSGGQPLKLMGVNYDVTAQKRDAEMRSRSQKLEALGTLSSGIAHDFNNILQAITGNAAMGLSQLPEGHAAKQHVLEIARAAARATDLVQQILSFTRPQEQKRRVVVLRNIVTEALRLVRATLPSTIDIKTSFDEQAPSVFADPSEVHQVLVNLATNAGHAIGKRGGTIEVILNERLLSEDDPSCRVGELPAGRYAELAVRDDGSGMDRATLERVFDPFFTTKPVGEGTGLGLSVVHGIMRSLQGAVTASSQPGQGSTFRLYFRGVESSIASVPVSAPRLPRGKGQLVLFVDDEPALTLMGKHMLAHLGYQADVFNDPRAAVQAFTANPERYALVITDLSMPTMTGFALAMHVHRLRPELPVLVASGYARSEEQEHAQRIGVRELLLKPVSMEKLAQALASCIKED